MPIPFSSEEVSRFAEWSADCNPLHVDDTFARQTHFGGRIVHGVLTAIEAFRSVPSPARDEALTSLEIEFRGAVVSSGVYETQSTRKGDALTLSLDVDNQPVLVARAQYGLALEAPHLDDTSWFVGAARRMPRTTPADRTLEELERGLHIHGAYPAAVEPFATSGLPPLHVRVLALCSYVVGMEAPGLKSLFTRLSVDFYGDGHAAPNLLYRVRTVRFDPVFRLLDTEVQVVSTTGEVVAIARVRAYVPFSPAETNPARLSALLGERSNSLAGKVALVIGGSRGLGAELAATLAVAGAQVYVNSRHNDDTRQRWHDALIARGCSVTFIQGDGGDPAWCESTLEIIRSRHGRLDVLLLNACARPTPVRVGPAAAVARAAYVADNLRLVEIPLALFAGLVEESSGTIAYLSSSYVETSPSGFAHYVAVKTAGEALLRSVCREGTRTTGLILRPPELQTRWNDTPAAVHSAIPPEWVAVGVTRALAENARSAGSVEVISEFPAIQTSTVRPGAGPSDFTLRIAASFTIDPALPALHFWTQELELNAAVEAAGYGQVLQSLLDPSSGFNSKGRAFNVLFLRVSDWLREIAEQHAESVDYAATHLRRTARDFEGAIRAHRQQASSDTLLALCPADPTIPPSIGLLVADIESQLLAALQGLPGLDIITAESYHSQYSVRGDEIHDTLRDEIGHIPFRDEYFFTLATIAVRHAHRRLAPIRKVVTVDCDNTLWRGVVGEVGPEGIEIDEGHRALHRTLARLAQNGVLVCLCSKNDESDVWRVFDTRSDMLLRREHVVAAMVNWLPKSQNLKSLAGRLNLGLDSFVFVDDNPVECAEVRAGCPEVLTIQWPQDAADAIRLLEHTWEFDARETTKEDARRTQMYQEEFKRQDLSVTLTFQDFIESLNLTVDFAPPAEEEIKRAAQLTLRTNQFNFTTIRREEADIRSLIAGGRHEVRTIKVRDRFGDYGLVGLIIVERGDDVWALDTFLLSCRVLGRGVEHHLAAELGRLAAAAGARTVRMRVEPTKRNTPARTFLQTIVPAELLNGLESEMPVETLAAVRFDPSSGPTEVPEDAPVASAATPQSAERLRRREEQITRAAFQFNTGTGLRAAISGIAASPSVTPTTDEDVIGVVRGAFAAALRTTTERVAELDRLEALGCDSIRVVEITVALREKFPWLPPTLLFEHQSVSAIIGEIAALASRNRVAEPVAAAAAPAQSRHAVNGRSGDIAVVGRHVRCAGVNSPEDLWQLLSQGGSSVRPVAADRPQFLKPLRDTRGHWAGLLDDVARFDAELFGISPREAEFMDPQTRLFLEVAWGALEDAGCLGANHEPATGVFAGVMYADYGVYANDDPAEHNNAYRCWEGFSLANRLSQLLGYGGPSLAVDTACSSSATALHLACVSLKAGDCPVAVVGGVNLILDPDRFASLGRLGILSERGQCEPFGANADGTVLGEGAGVVVLRPLEDAIRRGDLIYGVIKGTGISTGNGTVGFTAPNPQAQAEAIRRSLTTAGVDPRTISYIETHGTGTGLGDPIEVRGLTLGYDRPELRDAGVALQQYCRMGSIKPNIGHLEAGAGIMGLIKVLLQLQHGMLLPSITSPEPSPAIAFAKGTFEVQRQLEPWQRRTFTANGQLVSVPRRAGLSSFGVGGANAHIVIEEAPQPQHTTGEIDRPAHVLVLSARSADALQCQAASVRQHIDAHVELSLADFSYTANTGRRTFEHRLAIPFASREELLQGLKLDTPAARRGARGMAATAKPKIAFLFTGQGSQYAGMGRQLYATQPVFRDALDRCAAVFSRHLDRPLLDLLFAEEGSPEAELINQTGYTQPALFSFEYAMSALWQSWGITPDVVMGHSVGEIAAMCVAGGVSLEDGLKLIAARGRLMQALPPGGTMTSVMADERKVLEALEGEEELVAIAAINAPAQVVISGAGSRVAAVTARLEAAGVKAKALTVSHAFHSPLMKPMLAEYERVVREIRFTPPHTPIVSGVTAGIGGDDITTPNYWLRNVMDPVRFAAGMRTLEAAQVTAYVEVGPHAVLLGMGRQCVEDEGAATWLPSVKKDTDTWQTILGSVARLHVQGAPVDWKAFDAPYARHKVAVPPSALGGRQFWLKSLKDSTRVPAARTTSTVPARDSLAVYELAWRAQEPLTTSIDRGRWLIFEDTTGVAAELERVLRNAGASVIRAIAGPRYAELDGGFVVNPESREDFERLLDRVTARDQAAPRIANLWGLDAGATLSTESWLASAAYLVQALSAKGVSRRTLWMVTREAVWVNGIASTRPIAVDQAAAWGFGRTVALEHPELWGGLIDLDDDASRDATLLAREVSGNGNEDQVALRHGHRFVPRLSPKTAASAPPKALDGTGTYLITGGTGALGLQMAQWLVNSGARNLVLASRHGNGTNGVGTRIDELQRRGATVTVVAADVSRAEGVETMLAAVPRGSQLRGIVHAAGVDTPVPLQALGKQDIGSVLASKLDGSRLLHERTRHLDLDLFLGFSSVSSVLGAQGRAHYAAANACLDALIAERRRLGLAATGANWGPWKGGGMATDAHLQQFERIGNRGLDPAAAMRTLDALVAERAVQASVVDIDWTTFGPLYESRRSRPIVSEALQEKTAPADVPTDAPSTTWIDQLRAVGVDQRRGELERLLQAEVADTLGFDNPTGLTTDRNFYDIGMDSLLMADLVGRLKNRLAMPCSTLVFEHPQISALASALLEQISFAPAATVEVSPMPAAPAPSVSDDEIFAFQQITFPQRSASLIVPRWRWMFFEAAERLGVDPKVWVHREQGTIVAQMGSIPVRLKIGDEQFDTGWLVETMVREDYRAQALGSRLMVQAHDDQPLSLSLGQSAEMREIQYRLGWKHVAPLETAQAVVRARNVLKGKLPSPVAWAAGATLDSSAALMRRLRPKVRLTVRQVSRFDARHDELWRTVARGYTTAVVRDASYLNWKYVDQPGQDLVRLELSDGSEVVGVAIWSLREPDGIYGYRRALLLDLVAPLGNGPALRNVIANACSAPLEAGADALVCLHISARLTSALRACGFQLRQPTRHLLVDPGPLAGRALDGLLAPDAWFVTQGDSDIDRPW